MKTEKNFDDFRFGSLNYKYTQLMYLTMDRFSKNENHIVVKVDEEHLIKTTYGYALVLDATRVVFLKNWQVSMNYYGNEVLLVRDYFVVKDWGEHYDFDTDDNYITYDSWVSIAKIQQNAGNKVMWL